MKGFVRNLLALTGAASIVAGLYAMEHLDRKLHESADGLKYGPARHVEYLGDVLHGCNSVAKDSAIALHRKVRLEMDHRYDDLEDARNQALRDSYSV